MTDSLKIILYGYIKERNIWDEHKFNSLSICQYCEDILAVTSANESREIPAESLMIHYYVLGISQMEYEPESESKTGTKGIAALKVGYDAKSRGIVLVFI